MKRLNGKRGLLRAAALGQVLLLVVAGCKSPGEKSVSEETVRQALASPDGDLTVNAANTIVNGYSALTATGTNTVTVNAIADFAAGGRPALAVGDLVLIIQMQGATIGTPNDATYGNVTNYYNAGNYEFAGVAAIAGKVITLGCALHNAYTVAGNAQVIRVPQYATLTVTGSITAPAWDGNVGGVVAVQAATTLQLNGSIDVAGKGFQGGAADNASAAIATDITTYRSTANTYGGEKGESIAGLAANLANGRYGRGAPANGGGGGNSHNAGGGGGANAGAILSWTGQGVMSAVTGGTGVTSAWRLDPGYTANGGAPTTSTGGGRGGYTFSGNQQNPTANGEGPGVANWGGNSRRERGGMGGHPLTASAGGKLFLGGGGGAGDGNDGHAGPGGQGGGMVFVIAGTVQGAGSIVANGAPGGASITAATDSGDAPGGGGGGGTVVVRAAALSGISVQANGGLGGNQTVNNQYEAEGPGGGGGGGYVALSGGTVSVLASGRLGGTTNSPGVAQFPSNGATAGYDGVTDGDAATILYCTAANTTLDTTIASAPATLTNVAAATFTFTSVPATGVTFQCILDGNETDSWTTTQCSSPYTTPALAGGTHVIYVRSKDAVGNVDTTPASYTWTVDLTRPDTTIVTNPDNPSNSPTGGFTFSGSDTGGGAVTFECRIDTTTTWTACLSPYTTPALTDGSHTLYVRAVDAAGNVDATPESYPWVVHLLGLDGSVVDTAVLDSAVIDTAVIDTAVIDTAVVIVDSAVPDTRPDSAVPDSPIVVSPDVRLDSPVADRAPDLLPDAPAVGIPDAEADGGLADALADVGARDAVAKDTQVFPVVDSSPIDTTAPNPVPDAEIVVDTAVPDTAVPVPPVPDAAVGPGPQEPAFVLNNPKVMGSGFCAVNPMPNSAPGLFTFFLVAAFGLLVSRRRRR
jgi:hypothetical protein